MTRLKNPKKIKQVIKEELDVDWTIGPENIHGAGYGDIFWFRYYDYNIFFYCNYQSLDKVSVVELATKKVKGKVDGKWYDAMCVRKGGLVASKEPLIAKKPNNFRDSRYWVYTDIDEGEVAIIVTVDLFSKLYNKAENELDIKFPKNGCFYARRISDTIKKNICRCVFEIEDVTNEA